MGNIAIALPSDPAIPTANETNGIPVMNTQQESRSVLNNDMPAYHYSTMVQDLHPHRTVLIAVAMKIFLLVVREMFFAL